MIATLSLLRHAIAANVPGTQQVFTIVVLQRLGSSLLTSICDYTGMGRRAQMTQLRQLERLGLLECNQQDGTWSLTEKAGWWFQ